MKTRTILAVLFTLTLPSIAQTYSIGTFDLAGLPMITPPPVGRVLPLAVPAECAEDSSLEVWDGNRAIGHVPARFRPAVREMLRRGVLLEVVIVRQYSPARPGRYLEVELRATAPEVSWLIPLVDAIESSGIEESGDD